MVLSTTLNAGRLKGRGFDYAKRWSIERVRQIFFILPFGLISGALDILILPFGLINIMPTHG